MNRYLLTCCAALLTAMPVAHADPAKVTVRGGIHDAFNRLVFDFGQSADATAETNNQTVILTFTQSGNADLAFALAQHMPLIKGISVLATDPLRIEIDATRAVNPKMSKGGGKIIVDLYPGAPPKKDAKPEPDTKKTDVSKEDSKSKEKQPLELTPWSEKQDLSDKSAPAPTAPVKAVEAQSAPAPVAAKPVEKHVIENPVVASKADFVAYPSMQLTVETPVKLAAFQRGKSFWLVFEGNNKNIPTAVKNDKNDQSVLPEIERYEIGNATAYRLLVKGPVLPNVKIKDKNLTIDFAKDEAKSLSMPSFQFTVQTNSRNKLNEYVVKAEQPGAVIPIKDPEIGDTLFVAPVDSVVEKGTEGRNEVQFQLLPTWRGVAVAPKIDDLVVTKENNAVVISSPGGAIASNGVSAANSGGSEKHFFPLEEWRKTDSTPREKQMELEKSLVGVEDAKRNDIMVKLAQFHFANGHGQEAQGWLHMLGDAVQSMDIDPKFRALHAANLILAHNVDDGEQLLANNEDLKKEPEIALWRAYGAAQQEKWDSARPLFQQAGGLLFDYPEPFQHMFLLAAADMALAENDSATADYVLNALDKMQDKLQPRDLIRYQYQRALSAAARGEDSSDALAKIADANDDQYAPKAELALIQQNLKTKKIEPADAINKLESLRFGWRGDDFEIKVLNQLADLYLQTMKPRQALDTLKVITRNFPNTDKAAMATKKLQDLLVSQFQLPQLEKLSPIEAAALFQDYQDFLPDPASRTDIKSKLADRMIAVGFLDQATSILGDLTKDQQGKDKTATLLKLAGIQLLNNQPDQAVQALDQWVKEPSVKEQSREAVLLRARALMMQKNYDAALDGLKDINDDDAKRLKIDIYWRAQKWALAAQGIADLLGAPKPDALDDEQQKLVLNRAIALALVNDQANLQQWRTEYKTQMDTGKLASAFDLVTRPSNDGGLSSIQTIQARMGEVDLFKNFLKNYAPQGTNAPASAAPPAAAASAPDATVAAPSAKDTPVTSPAAKDTAPATPAKPAETKK